MMTHSLKEVFRQAKQQGIGVTLGFNDNEAGRKMAKQAAEIASRQGITCQVEWPTKGKDWNEILLAFNQQIAQVSKQKHHTAFARSL
jgi:hypothetical protein